MVGIMHLSLHLSDLDFLPHFPLFSIPPSQYALSFLPQTQLFSPPFLHFYLPVGQ